MIGQLKKLTEGIIINIAHSIIITYVYLLVKNESLLNIICFLAGWSSLGGKLSKNPLASTAFRNCCIARETRHNTTAFSVFETVQGFMERSTSRFSGSGLILPIPDLVDIPTYTSEVYVGNVQCKRGIYS